VGVTTEGITQSHRHALHLSTIGVGLCNSSTTLAYVVALFTWQSICKAARSCLPQLQLQGQPTTAARGPERAKTNLVIAATLAAGLAACNCN
jgi:hypothetical protein